ncbi:hypothetical protein [Cellvibrio mixtus]|uniref:hypothetical protein n=1 Tax=Cellvibrio mixtus TaxID=39650 RepID=UPI000586BD74|nr:hypothetical protein [Cellvibrio mixtus]
MNKVIVNVPNAILFIVDLKNNETVIPVYIPDQVASATDTCVSVATQAPEDGETEVSLVVNFENSLNYHHVFEGSISIYGGKIAVVTAELETLLELDVPNGKAAFSIFVNDVHHPSVVIVSLLNKNTF